MPMNRRRFLVATLACVPLPALAAPHRQPIKVTLYKSPQCTCCEGYADYLRQNGFAVDMNPTNDLAEIDRKAGLTEAMEGCHMSFVGDYFVSGHVPVEAVHRLLAEHPAIKGITLPGMPEGSPGMVGTKQSPFTIYAIAKNNRSSVYMTV